MVEILRTLVGNNPNRGLGTKRAHVTQSIEYNHFNQDSLKNSVLFIHNKIIDFVIYINDIQIQT